jgi:cysteine-rich repeat protein
MRSRVLALVLVSIAGCSSPSDVNGLPDVGARDAADVGADTNVDTWAAPRCGDGHVDPGEACDDGNANDFDGCTNDCRVPPTIGPPDRTWTWYEIPGTQCIDGTATGFGVSIASGSPDLMIYLEGGGACFSDACDFTALSVPFVPPPDGIFDRTQSSNPVRDWNMVYVPYCTGDIYAGDADTMLAGSVRHFHGYRNITLDLEAIVPSFPHVTRVLWTGISAGGFGSGLNAARAADAFGPPRQMILIDDSGPPLGNDVIAPCLEQIFRDTWGLDHTLLAECASACSNPTDFASGVIGRLIARHPDMRVGMFSNTQDTVIRAFMGAGWGDGMLNNCSGVLTSVPPDVYQSALVGLRTRYGAHASFYLNGPTGAGGGLGHTTLRGPSYYQALTGGVTVADWVAQVIAGMTVQVGP